MSFERAQAWADDEPRLSAAIVYGSVARSQEHAYSDLDLLLVATDGQRASLWDDRAAIAAHLLGGPVGFSMEPFWQRPYRYQAWSEDLTTMLDLTCDEGSTAAWGGLADGLVVLVDRDGVAASLADALPSWSAPEADAAMLDVTTWPWFAYLDGQLRKNRGWIVRAGCHDTLGNRVVTLLGAAPHSVEEVLSTDLQRALTEAAPRSSEPAELRRALAATVALYDVALDHWSARTGNPRPNHPLAASVRDRVATIGP